MPRPIQATLDIPALRHNLSQIKVAAPDALVWAVVKANAYGHGIERILRAYVRPTALRCSICLKLSGFDNLVGAVPFSCWKAPLKPAIWRCALA